MSIYLPFAIPVVAILYVLCLEFFVVRPQVRKNQGNEKAIRKVVIRDYMLGVSRSNFLTIVVALSAVLIAFNSVKISVQEGEATRLHNQLSVKPHLNISYFANDRGAGFVANSTGLGPAIVKWAGVWIDGKPISSWKEIESTLDLPKDGYDGIYINPYPGIIFRPGDAGTLYSVKEKEDIDFLDKNYGRIKINLCYCSFYSEVDDKQCWQTSNFFNEIRDVCSEKPEIIFPIQ
ncbi:MAG: hypothetical protein HY445_00145 [Candidatus Niyogibacteria bacterium]|nr:hypothetical protein [Candidatus Niyogibacteria bacterium]